MSNLTSMPRVLTIAGSDSGAGAGIQADLKTFAANGVYGTSVITAITAQNTLRVTEVLEIPASLVASQIDSVLGDIGTDSVKTGMLFSSEIVSCVAQKLVDYEVGKIVVDPVMIAKGGDELLQKEAIDALREILIPMATVVTPNVPEAVALTGIDIVDDFSAKKACKILQKMGAETVVLKGGHLKGRAASDLFHDGSTFKTFTTKRVDTKNTHGTGCTFASAVAAGLAKEETPILSVSNAKTYVTGAILNNFSVGMGHGPLNHFYEHW
jgi:hydroxymethylpyrimidine/phosphomethylpyrimidine kinase